MRALAFGLLASSGLLVGCGGGSSDPTPAMNQAPKLSAIADQGIVANQPGQSVGFSVTDEQPGSVSVTVSTDSMSLLPPANQTVSGTGAARTALLSPAPDELGQAVVTVLATDTAGLTDQAQFVVTVTAQQLSMQQFARTEIDRSADDEPELINAVEFTQDAEDDDFADLFVE